MSTITGTTVTSGVTLGTSGAYASPLTIYSNGAVEVTSGNAIYGPSSLAGATVVNGGTVSTQQNGNGIFLRDGGYVDNAAGQIASPFIGVYIQGAVGTVTNTGTIVGAGTGVQLGNGGTITNNTGLITGYDGVYVGFQARGTIINHATIIGTYSSDSYAVQLIGGGILNNTGLIRAESGFRGFGTIDNAGTITGTTLFGIQIGGGATVVDSGTISGGFAAIAFSGSVGDLLVLENGYRLIGGVEVIGTGAPALTLELAGSVGNAVTVGYDNLFLTRFGAIDVLFGTGGNARLNVTNYAGTLPPTISGFSATSDVIDLTLIGTDGTIANQSSTQLTVAGSDGTVTLKLDLSDATTFRTISDGLTGTELGIACFLRGTLILTEAGDVPVEDLAIGDRVVTISGAVRVIKWLGRRAYDGRFIATNRAVAPIRVERGALADGVPARDLYVSPEHALYIDGTLVPAGLLANGVTIRQVESIQQLEYFHLELDTHDVILAEGAPAETFVDCDNRGMFQNNGEFGALYPGNAAAPWQFCAPRVEPDSAELAAVRAALLARVEALGRITIDPDLHLIADGEIVRAQSVAGRVWRFALPTGTRALTIGSRRAVPAEVEAASADERALGVAVERIVVSGTGLRVDIGHDCPALRDGFHNDEATHRWTDGRGSLSAALPECLAGDLAVEVHLAETELRYQADPPRSAIKSFDGADRRSSAGGSK